MRGVHPIQAFRTPTHKPHYFFSRGGWWRIAHDGAQPMSVVGKPWRTDAHADIFSRMSVVGKPWRT